MKNLRRVTINRAALARNFAICRERAGKAGVIALVKADAYGHGMRECARLFARLGASGLAVAGVEEGAALRRDGLSLPIYVLAGLAPQVAKDIVAHQLTPLLSDQAMLRLLASEAEKQRKQLDVHLKVDVGMGRQGALPEDFLKLTQEAATLTSVRVCGMMAHLPKADDRESDNSARVRNAFDRVTREAQKLLPYPCTRHLANSGGLLYVENALFDAARPGIALYGYYPDGAQGRAAAPEPRLEPAMEWKVNILLVRQVPAGHPVGYDSAHITTRPTTIAILPVGYADGYARKLSARAQVLIGGRRAPVLGRVSMDLTTVDVTDIPQVKAGDEAVLLGRQGEEMLDADELAGWMETIHYEALCLIGRLNSREYIG